MLFFKEWLVFERSGFTGTCRSPTAIGASLVGTGQQGGQNDALSCYGLRGLSGGVGLRPSTVVAVAAAPRGPNDCASACDDHRDKMARTGDSRICMAFQYR
jgi:hypothetical protein